MDLGVCGLSGIVVGRYLAIVVVVVFLRSREAGGVCGHFSCCVGEDSESC